jgi:uncharacterized protein YlxP (DUF503 family)
MSGGEVGVFVGVVQLEVVVPGARSLKDGRMVVRSLRDRVRSRFDVSFHEIPHSRRDRVRAVITTAGNDPREVRSILDRIADFARASVSGMVGRVDVDVFRWHPPEDSWIKGAGLDGFGAGDGFETEDPDG